MKLWDTSLIIEVTYIPICFMDFMELLLWYLNVFLNLYSSDNACQCQLHKHKYWHAPMKELHQLRQLRFVCSFFRGSNITQIIHFCYFAAGALVSWIYFLWAKMIFSGKLDHLQLGYSIVISKNWPVPVWPVSSILMSL